MDKAKPKATMRGLTPEEYAIEMRLLKLTYGGEELLVSLKHHQVLVRAPFGVAIETEDPLVPSLWIDAALESEIYHWARILQKPGPPPVDVVFRYLDAHTDLGG